MKQNRLTQLLVNLPSAVRDAIRGKAEDIANSTKLRGDPLPLDWNEAAARTVSGEIEELLKRGRLTGIRTTRN